MNAAAAAAATINPTSIGSATCVSGCSQTNSANPSAVYGNWAKNSSVTSTIVLAAAALQGTPVSDRARAPTT